MLLNSITPNTSTITQDQTSSCFDKTLSSFIKVLKDIKNENVEPAVSNFIEFCQENESQLEKLITQNKLMPYTVGELTKARSLVGNAKVDNTSTDECTTKAPAHTLSATLTPLKGLLEYELSRFEEAKTQQLNTKPEVTEKQECSSVQQNADANHMAQQPAEEEIKDLKQPPAENADKGYKPSPFVRKRERVKNQLSGILNNIKQVNSEDLENISKNLKITGNDVENFAKKFFRR